MARWHLHHGRWWMVQYQWDGWLSLGIHVDWRRRRMNSPDRPDYGPYADLHVGPAIISLGNRPAYTDAEEAQLTTCRGGVV